MKNLLILSILLFFTFKVNAQEKFEKFTVNLGLTHPIHYVPNYMYKFTIDTEIELLMNFRIFENSILSAGLGLQSCEHIRIEEVSHLVWVDGIGLLPYEFTNYWNLKFLSAKVPVYIAFPFKNSFLESYIAGFSLGRYWNINLSEKSTPNPPQIKIDRNYLDFNFGVKKNLYQTDKLSINLSPYLGYLIYLTDYNDWQKNYIFFQIKFNINF